MTAEQRHVLGLMSSKRHRAPQMHSAHYRTYYCVPIFRECVFVRALLLSAYHRESPLAKERVGEQVVILRIIIYNTLYLKYTSVMHAFSPELPNVETMSLFFSA